MFKCYSNKILKLIKQDYKARKQKKRHKSIEKPAERVFKMKKLINLHEDLKYFETIQGKQMIFDWMINLNALTFPNHQIHVHQCISNGHYSLSKIPIFLTHGKHQQKESEIYCGTNPIPLNVIDYKIRGLDPNDQFHLKINQFQLDNRFDGMELLWKDHEVNQLNCLKRLTSVLVMESI